jgi:hypothetical protein
MNENAKMSTERNRKWGEYSKTPHTIFFLARLNGKPAERFAWLGISVFFADHVPGFVFAFAKIKEKVVPFEHPRDNRAKRTKKKPEKATISKRSCSEFD